MITLEANLNDTTNDSKLSYNNNTGQGKVTSIKIWIVLHIFRRVVAKEN